MITENNLRDAGENGVGSETNRRPAPGKNGLNGGANSLRMMGKSVDSSTEQPSISNIQKLRNRWEDFKLSRETYSLWWFPPEHKYVSPLETKLQRNTYSNDY